MSFQNIKTSVLQYKIAVAWFVLFSINSLGTCILSASSGCVWDNLDWQAKTTVVVAIFVNWTGTIMAFLSTASKKIKSGSDDVIPDATTPKP